MRKENKKKREERNTKRIEKEKEERKKAGETKNLEPEKEKEWMAMREKIAEERKKKIEQMNAETKKIVSPNYRKIEKEYSQKTLMPYLEQKKKILNSLRDLHKPLNHDELQEYRSKIDS